jgi:hypothetical protein
LFAPDHTRFCNRMYLSALRTAYHSHGLKIIQMRLSFPAATGNDTAIVPGRY